MPTMLRNQSLDTSGNEILDIMENNFNVGIPYNQARWQQASIDNNYYAGQQDVGNTFYSAFNTMQNSRQFYYNRSNPIVNMISGYQRDNRKSTIGIPKENGNQETADLYSKAIMWNNEHESVLETISDAFHGALVSGMTMLNIYMDYGKDPVSGDIKIDNLSYNGFMIDPFFRKADLSDCNWIWKRSFLTRKEASVLMPEHAEEIASLSGNSSALGPDAKFSYMPEVYNFNMTDLLTYDEYSYRTFRKQINLVDTRSGESWEWPNQDTDKLSYFLSKEPQITTIETEIPTNNLCIAIQNRVFYNSRNPSGSDLYPYIPVFAYWNPQMPNYDLRVRSVVSGLRDPQYLYNKFLNNIGDILDSQVNSGHYYKEDALVDPDDIYMNGNGKGIALKSGASMDDVRKIPCGDVSSGFFRIAEIFSEELFKDSGANEATMGSAVDDKAGILEMVRQGAGLRTLRILFDQLDRSQKLLGKIQLDYIQKNFTPGKIRQITDEEPTPQFYQYEFGQYGIAIEEGFNTTTQKQLAFAQALKLLEAGVPIPHSKLLEMSTLQNKNELIEAMQKEQLGIQQMQQQEQQIQMQLQMAQIELAHARAKADIGLYAERTSRVDENRASAVERLHQANRDDEAALLDKIRAVKELDMMDISHVKELIAAADILKKQEQASIQQEVQSQGVQQ